MSKEQPTQLWIKEGATIKSNGRDYVVVALADINLVLAKEVGSGEKVLLKIGDLGPPKLIGELAQVPKAERELLQISDADWQIAEERRRYIDPLLNSSYQRIDAQADKIAAEAEVDRATIYRWLAKFKDAGLLSSLLPKTGDKGGMAEGVVLLT